MNNAFHALFSDLGEKLIVYLPNLLAGIALVVIGWILGWISKRLIIQFAVILRLERFLLRFQWGKDFSKADIRYGFYNFWGNIVFFIIFFVFLDNAFNIWKLTILSDLLKNAILFLPRVILAAIVFGFGWLVSSWTSRAVLKALSGENIPRSTLITRFVKTTLLLFFSAMALTELNIAREIIIIGFAVTFITLGGLTLIFGIFNGRTLFNKIIDSSDRSEA